MPRSEIAQSYDNSILPILKDGQNIWKTVLRPWTAEAQDSDL